MLFNFYIYLIMITNFKIFENQKYYHDEDDLVSLFSQKFIEEYYNDNCGVDIEDASMSVNLWDFVDKDKVKDDLIADLIEDKDIDDDTIFKKEDLIDYIKKFMLELVHDEIDDYRKKYEKDDLDDREMLDIIAKKDTLNKDLINLIEDKDKEFDLKKEFYEEKYYDEDAEYIIMDQHGKQTYNEDLYSHLFHYVDDNEVIDYYIDKIVDFSDKYELVKDSIYSSYKLQTDLFNIDKNTVQALFDAISHKSKLGKDYNFQKTYIDFIIDMEGFDKDEDVDEITELLVKIKEKFGLHPNLEKKYSVYMDPIKYNL